MGIALGSSLQAQEEPDHVFGPVKPEWTLREGWLRVPKDPSASPKPKDGMVTFRRDGLVYVADEDRSPGDRDLWRELRYFDGQRIAKTLLYDPERRLRSETEDTGREQFTRLLHLDGTTASYSHGRRGQWVDGFSTSAEGRTIARVIEGAGRLIEPGYGTGDWYHHWIRDGKAYLSKEYRGGYCIWIALGVKTDSFVARPGDELLSLWADCESWTRETGKPPVVNISEWYINAEDGSMHRRDVPPKTDIRPIPMVENSRGNPEAEIRKIQEEWARAYPKRRAAFVAAYGEGLKGAGESWSSLGIDFIRTDGAWLSAATTWLPRLGGRRIAPYRCTVDLHSGKVEVDQPTNLQKDEGAAWDDRSDHVSREGHTFRVVVEDNRESRKLAGFPDWVRVSVTETEDTSRKIVRTIAVQEFQGEHERHGSRALILKDGKIRFWVQFWVGE